MGASSVQQLKTNLATLDKLDFSPFELQEIEEVLKVRVCIAVQLNPVNNTGLIKEKLLFLNIISNTYRNMKRLILILIFCMTLAVNTNAQAPEIYNRVNHVIWIVEDLRTVKKNWQQLGFDQIKEEGDVTILSKFSGEGEAVKARMAIGYMDTLRVIWIQSPKRGNPFSDYMRNSKEGVYSLVYTVENKKALKEEAQRLKDLDITILDNLEIRTSHGKFNYYLFNTAQGREIHAGISVGGRGPSAV